jgi:hypothetical protein
MTTSDFLTGFRKLTKQNPNYYDQGDELIANR